MEMRGHCLPAAFPQSMQSSGFRIMVAEPSNILRQRRAGTLLAKQHAASRASAARGS